jgi:hypothetical protein
MAAMTVPRELQVAGFAIVPTRKNWRLVLATAGREKQGKTTFAMTAPDPIAVVTADTGTVEICQQKKFAHKQILMCALKVPDLSTADMRDDKRRQELYEPQWEEAKDAILAAIKSRVVRTLVVDTGTEIWELCRLARFGKLAQVKPQHYGPVNAEMRELIKAAYERDDLNCIWTHKVKKEYKESKTRPGETVWTGTMELAGFGDIAYLTDFSLWHSYIKGTDDEPVGIFTSKIMDCPRQAGDLMGMDLEGEDSNFPFLAQLMYPEAGEDYWKSGRR